MPGMIDISDKKPTNRVARAQAEFWPSAEVLKRIKESKIEKGDAFEVARVAATLAAKNTPAILPLCHPLRITSVQIRFEMKQDHVHIVSEVKAADSTGVEMEALVAAATAALTLYDLCKPYDQSIAIKNIFLLEKHGGKSDYTR